MTTPSRICSLERQTAETQIQLTVNLDGTGESSISTGVGFFDHMLVLFAKHSAMDLTVQVRGDLRVDGHHTVEDTGIVLGTALRTALGDKRGIRRYGFFTLPMDETLATVAVDFSGRPFYVAQVAFPSPKIGDFDSELFVEFWQAVTNAAQMNLHQIAHYGRNGHHIAEALFKATGRAMRAALEVDPRIHGVPSTKGSL